MNFYSERASILSFKGEKELLASTMLQDITLSTKRHLIETRIIRQVISKHRSQRVLDIGCGVGRIGFEIKDLVECYLGTDVIPEYISIAQERAKASRGYRYKVFPAEEVSFEELNETFDLVIISGLLVYMNDKSVNRLFFNLKKLLPHGILYLREPIGIDYRLTLINEWSSELKSQYSAIYRTRQQIENLAIPDYDEKDFEVFETENVYPHSLNNRLDTRQRYWIFRRLS